MITFRSLTRTIPIFHPFPLTQCCPPYFLYCLFCQYFSFCLKTQTQIKPPKCPLQRLLLRRLVKTTHQSTFTPSLLQDPYYSYASSSSSSPNSCVSKSSPLVVSLQKPKDVVGTMAPSAKLNIILMN